MEDTFSVVYDGSYVRVALQGKEDLVVANRLWSQVKEACEKHQCFKVLGVAETTKPLNTMDSYSHADLFTRLGIDSKYHIAWAELNPEAYKAARVAEAALFSRALPGLLFTNVKEAEEWLKQF